MAQIRAQVESTAGTSAAGETAILLQRVLHKFVAEPKAIEIGIQSVGEATVFKMRLARRDLEKLAESPRTVTSLKCIVEAFGQRSGQRFTLEIPKS